MVFENPSWSTFVSEVTKYEKAKYDGYLFGWGIITGEPDQLMGDHFYSVNVALDALQQPRGRSADRSRRARTSTRPGCGLPIMKAQEILWDECPWIWLYEQPDITAINKKLQVGSPAAATST